MRECQNDLAAGSADRYHPGHIFRGTQCEEQKMRMRQSITIVSMVFFAAIASTSAQGAKPETSPYAVRYGIRANQKRFDQTSPRRTVRAAIKAIEGGKVEYLLAHLVSPHEVDRKFRGDRIRLSRLAATAAPKQAETLRDTLRQHLDKGRWTVQSGSARSRVEGAPDLTLQRVGRRWFLQNATQFPVKR
jgi:hypothetical protein